MECVCLTGITTIAFRGEGVMRAMRSCGNAARLAAMESAHDNVGKRPAQLREDARQARQTGIAAELPDLITGAEARRTDSRRVGLEPGGF